MNELKPKMVKEVQRDSRCFMAVAPACEAFWMKSHHSPYFYQMFFVIHQLHRESFNGHGKTVILASLISANYIIIKYGDRKWIPISKGKRILYNGRSYRDQSPVGNVFDSQYILRALSSILYS